MWDVGWRSDGAILCISAWPLCYSLQSSCKIRFISEEKLQKIAIQKLTKIQSSTCKFYKGSAKIFIYKIRYYCCSMCRYFSSFSTDPSIQSALIISFQLHTCIGSRNMGTNTVLAREREDKNKNISSQATWLMTLVSLKCGQCLIYSPGNRDPQYNDKTG